MTQKFGQIPTGTDMKTTAEQDAGLAAVPRVYKNGVIVSTAKEYWSSGTVSAGIVTFYLTDDHTSGGAAIFANIYKESMNFFVEDSSNSYQFSNVVIASDKKSVTVAVGQLGAVLVGIIQFLSAANGVTVYLQVKGN